MSEPKIKRRMLVSIEEREDGKWRCELVGGSDDSTMPGAEFQRRREFLRQYHRALEQMNNLVFRGGIRRV